MRAHAGARAKLLEVSRRLRDKCAGLIRARRRETRARRAARPADILDALLALRDTAEEALVSMLMEFALAGSHTTSQTLAWCVYEVAGQVRWRTASSPSCGARWGMGQDGRC